jgi:hypothetical protein
VEEQESHFRPIGRSLTRVRAGLLQNDLKLLTLFSEGRFLETRAARIESCRDRPFPTGHKALKGESYGHDVQKGRDHV